jgi:hypothetical protein
MARPGPPPKYGRTRRNADPLLGPGGQWRSIPNVANAGDIPPVPSWLANTLKSPATLELYDLLMRLPQAALWGPGEMLVIYLTLPLLDRYLQRAGAEAYRAILAGLGGGVGITESDLLKMRTRLTSGEPENTEPTSPPRRRLIAVDPLPPAED